MLVDELRATFLAEGLTDDQLADFVAAGEEVPFTPGDVLFEEGAAADFLWVLLEGRLELARHSGTETIVITTMTTPGQWAGGLRAWGEASNSAGYRAMGRAASDGRCFRVPSDELSRLVGEWFPFGRHMIVGIYQTVRGIEAMARQRESLVALGTLAAGLAHEINNPAAAALRAVDSLGATCDSMLSSLASLARHTITADQFVALDELRREVVEAPPTQEGALATTDREEAIGEWLERQGIDDAWQVAPALAAAGADRAWCRRVEAVTGPEPLGAALRWIASTASSSALLGELQDTTTRISQLVDAVKSYSQMDRGALQTIDVREGIESTLVMLAHKLRDIEVELVLVDDLPPVEAYAGELNQVWTNLVDNAIDAMEGRGTLRVATQRDGGEVVVDITDSGHGMPADVEERAFEPFFTTKEVGKGTGLGLDISRRIIVERHGGEISFDSSPSGTTVHVRLPLTR